MTRLLFLSAAVICLLIDVTSGQGFATTGSCAAICGRSFPRHRGLCNCDVNCRRTRSCCEDYETYCVASCEGTCGTPFTSLIPCQCYDGCNEAHCCEDFKRICEAGNETTTAASTTTPTQAPLALARIAPDRQIERGYSYITNRQVYCPRGVPFTECFINPCSTCPRFPSATCLVNECGGCRAKYVDHWGNEVDCYDPDKFCANGQRIHDCGNIDLCKYSTCPGFPRAICVPNKCGGCFYNFVDSKGNKVDCDVEHGRFGCKPGVEREECEESPCLNAVCRAYPTASCQDVECGGCRAEFVDKDGDVLNCNDTKSPPCPPSQRCPKGLCDKAQCPGRPRAECRESECGDCGAKFYYQGQKLRDIDCVIPNACIEKTSCLRDPCEVYTCAAKKPSICIGQFCDCSALFFDYQGNLLTKEDCMFVDTTAVKLCPSGKPRSRCSVERCRTSRCGSFTESLCTVDECDNCKLLFFSYEGKQLDCTGNSEIPAVTTRDTVLTTLPTHDTSTITLCPSGAPPKLCDPMLCVNTPCRRYHDTVCAVDYCDNCKLIYFDKSGNILDCSASGRPRPETTTTTTTTTQAPTTRSRPLCPSGIPRMSCTLKRCQRITCPTDPKAFCVENPCDRCKPLFFNLQGKRVDCSISSQTNAKSCFGKCGDEMTANGGCQCDYNCVRRGDCCADFSTTCQTCRKSCGLHKPTSLCQCTSDCKLLRNCCRDFDEVCLKGKTCRNRCKEKYKFYEPCQCVNSCITRRNCCPDYKDHCM